MKRFTFIEDDYYAISGKECFDTQNENYCGPAVERLAQFEDAIEKLHQRYDAAKGAEKSLLGEILELFGEVV